MKKRLWGVLLLALGAWVGVEIWNKGFDGAFDGALASWSAPLQSDSSTDSSLKNADESHSGDEDDD